jgi:hypothetical protein
MYELAGIEFCAFLDGPGLPVSIRTEESRVCGFCGQIAYSFVNRFGRTRCLACDAREYPQRGEEP